MVGRLFREFAVTLSGGDPHLARSVADDDADDVWRAPQAGAFTPTAACTRASGRLFEWMGPRLRREPVLGAATPSIDAPPDARTVGINGYLFAASQRVLPTADTGRLSGPSQAAQDISFEALKKRASWLRSFDIIQTDPAVESVMGSPAAEAGPPEHRARVHPAQAARGTGGQRRPGDRATARKVARVPGAPAYLQAVQDLRIGRHGSNARINTRSRATTSPS